MAGYIEQNLRNDEEVVYSVKIHWARLIPHFLLIFAWGIGLITMIPVLISMYTTKLVITNKRLIGKVGLLNTQSLDSPLNKINNTSVSSGILGKMFGYGNVNVLTSSGTYYYKGIAQADNFRTSLMNQIEQYDEDRIKKQATELAQAIKS